MNIEELIKQLEGLKDHCKDWVEEDKEADVWANDVLAIDKAIDIIENKKSIVAEEYRDLKDKQLAIIEHYGTANQLNKLIEECSELISAIVKLRDNDNLVERLNFIEELADVKNMIEQFELYIPNVREGVKRNLQHKVDRELGRIKSNGNL